MPSLAPSIRLSLSAEDRAMLRGIAGALDPLATVQGAGSRIRTKKGAKAKIKRLLRRPSARGYLGGLLEKADAAAEAATLLTVLEKRQFCADSLRASPAKLESTSPLIQEYRLTESESERGSSKTEVVKIMAKKDSITLDNQLAGHTHPDERPVGTDALGAIIADLAHSSRHPSPEDKM